MACNIFILVIHNISREKVPRRSAEFWSTWCFANLSGLSPVFAMAVVDTALDHQYPVLLSFPGTQEDHASRLALRSGRVTVLADGAVSRSGTGGGLSSL